MEFPLAFIRHEQNILLMSSFLLGNFCSLLLCGCMFCCTVWLSLWRNMNSCCGYLFLLPGTAITKLNVRLPLPQTITNFPLLWLWFQEALCERAFLLSEKLCNCEWACSLSSGSIGIVRGIVSFCLIVQFIA